MKLNSVNIKEDSYKEKINSSIFISHIAIVKTKDEAKRFIEKISKEYNDATHNVYAYRLIDYEKYGDDGEPAKTAGFPILNILKKKNLVNVVIVVTRYFKGTYLGIGGLIRAYSSMTQKLLDKQEFKEHISFSTYIFDMNDLNYKDFDYIKKILLKYESKIINIKMDKRIVIYVSINSQLVYNIKKSICEYFKIDIEELNKKIKITKEEKEEGC